MIRVAFRQAYWKEVQCNVFLPGSWNMEPRSSSLEAWWSLSGCLHGASTVTGSAPSPAPEVRGYQVTPTA